MSASSNSCQSCPQAQQTVTSKALVPVPRPPCPLGLPLWTAGGGPGPGSLPAGGSLVRSLGGALSLRQLHFLSSFCSSESCLYLMDKNGFFPSMFVLKYKIQKCKKHEYRLSQISQNEQEPMLTAPPPQASSLPPDDSTHFKSYFKIVGCVLSPIFTFVRFSHAALVFFFFYRHCYISL